MTTRPFDILDILTPRQREIYVFIRSKIQGRGYGPTVREIGNEFGIKSPNGVTSHLKALQKRGLINRVARMSRAIQLLQEDTGAKTIECPHCKKMIELPLRSIKSSCS